MEERYRDATPFSAFLEGVTENSDLWHGVYERAEVPDEMAYRAASLPGPWYLLALVEEWWGPRPYPLRELLDAIPDTT